MAIPLTINGVTYNYPELTDEGWGNDATNWAVAITQGTLQKSGGLFSLTGDVDFGPSFGLKTIYIKSRSSNIATTGFLRLSNSDSLSFRNSGNTGDLAFTAGSSDAIPQYNGIDLVNLSTAQSLTNKTLVGAVFTGGVLNSPTINTPTVSGGSFTSPSISTPTVSGGNFTSPSISTPTVTGGTFSDPSITGQGLFADGSASLPSFSFTSETNTGIFRPGGASLGFSILGSEVLQLNNTSIEGVVPFAAHNGSAAAPSLSFINSLTTGLYRFAANSLGFSTNGLVAGSIDSSQNWLINNNLRVGQNLIFSTLQSLQSSTVTIVDDGSSGGFKLNNSTTAGTLARFLINATGTNMDALFDAQSNGTGNAYSSYSLRTSANKWNVGFLNSDSSYTLSYGSLGFGLGVVPFKASTSGLVTLNSLSVTGSIASSTFSGPVLLPDGSLSAPSLSFTSETNTGFYKDGGASFTAIVSGVAKLQIASTSINASVDMGIFGNNSLKLYDSGNVNFIGLKAPSSTASYTITLPAAAPLTNTFLKFDGTNYVWTFSGGGDINNGGNSFTAPISIGTNDNFNLNLITNGVTRLTLNTSDQVLFNNGTVSAPAISWAAETNTGIFRPSGASMAFAVSGGQVLQLNAGNIEGSVPFAATDGTVSAPGLSFINELNSGFFKSATNEFSASANGTNILKFKAASLEPQVQILTIDGTVSTPSYSFASDNHMGMYKPSGNAIGFAIASAQKLQINSASIESTQPFLAPSGNTSNPSYAFSTSASTGLYEFAANSLGFATNSSSAGHIDASQNWTFVGTIASAGIVGVTDGSSANAGNVGEVLKANSGGGLAPANVSSTGTGQYFDVASVSLTAGDWLITIRGEGVLNGATVTEMAVGISSTTGNSSTGLVNGDTFFDIYLPTSSINSGFSFASYHVSISTTTTYYLKGFSTFTGGPTQIRGTIQAQRIR